MTPTRRLLTVRCVGVVRRTAPVETAFTLRQLVPFGLPNLVGTLLRLDTFAVKAPNRARVPAGPDGYGP
jgi:hypothetical protein